MHAAAPGNSHNDFVEFTHASIHTSSRGEHRICIYGYMGPRNMGPVTVPSRIEVVALRDG
jgi:hypothetical protein